MLKGKEKKVLPPAENSESKWMFKWCCNRCCSAHHDGESIEENGGGLHFLRVDLYAFMGLFFSLFKFFKVAVFVEYEWKESF